MNTLLFSKDKESTDIIAFAIESHFDAFVTCVDSFESAADALLGENSIDLILVDETAYSENFLKFMVSSGARIPIIFVAHTEKFSVKGYPDLNVAGSLQLSGMPDQLYHLIRKTNLAQSSGNAKYTRISVELLLQMASLRGDVYIRLSSIKFVKLFHRGQVLSHDDFEQYLLSKNLKYLYVAKDEAPEFVAKFKEELVQITKRGSKPTIQSAATVVEAVHDLVRQIGFTPQMQAIAKETVDLALAAIGTHPKLSEALKGINLQHRNYISSHSIIVAHIATCIASAMEWPSKTTFQKLTWAAFFHDISLSNQRLASLHSLSQLDPKIFTEEEIRSFTEHPAHAADIVRGLVELPPEVDVIVLQHHEAPDGAGFPHRLVAHRIAPLAAVFIVAHDIVHAIMRHKGEFQMKLFLEGNKEKYGSGPFKKVSQAIASLL